jgi:hypothetical protein
MKNLLFVFLVLMCSASISAVAAEELSQGQTLYLPIYSKIWHGDRVIDGNPIQQPLSALVSIRNTSLKTAIRIYSARYYGTDGKFLKEYLSKPLIVAAMGTSELFVERKELEGGSGANFIIQWDSSTATNPPVVEAVHSDIRSGSYALTFITSARSIQANK